MTVLSIIVTSRNTENYIKQAIESIKKQKYYTEESIEIIIVDDVSTDNTIEVINSINYDNKINIIQNRENVGPGESRNIGVRHASGRYIAYLDGDDYFANNYLETVLPYLDGGIYDLILLNYSRFYDESGEFYETSKIGIALDEQYTAAWNKVVKSSVAKKVPFLKDNLKWEDVYYTVTLNEEVKIATVVSSSLYSYRRRPGSISFSGKADLSGHKDIVVIFDMLDKKFSLKKLRDPNIRKLLNKQFFTHMAMVIEQNSKYDEIKDIVLPILERYNDLNQGLIPIFGVGWMRWIKNVLLIQLIKWHFLRLAGYLLNKIG